MNVTQASVALLNPILKNAVKFRLSLKVAFMLSDLSGSSVKQDTG